MATNIDRSFSAGNGGAGPPGADGRTVLSGTVDPLNTQGFNGDYYINRTTNFMFGPKAGGVWPAGFSLVGPTGPQGPAGSQGPQGPAGATGNTGPQGPAGPTGNTGPSGSAGAQGPAGAAGPSGRTILSSASAPSNGNGADGDYHINYISWFIYGPKASGVWPSGQSIIGPQGIQGIQGIQGPQGVQGDAGPAGATGPTGPQGATGNTGPQGPTGATGNTGATGLSLRTGSGAPSNALGNDGDMYIDTTAWNIRGPKAAGVWPGSTTSLIGPTGAQGAQGPQGIQGPTGAAGAAGAAGATGPTGPTGPSGTPGDALPYKTGTGRYISHAQDAATLSTIGGAANRMDLIPFLVPFDMTLTGLGVLCSTLVAAAQGKLCIYSSDANGRPSTLLEEISTVLDFSTTGFKSASFATSKSLTKGQLVWLGIRHSSTATLNGYATSSSRHISHGATPSTAPLTLLRRTVTFANAAPNPWTWVATEETNSVTTAIFMLGSGV